LGHNPEAIDRGLLVEEQPHPEQIPVGVPSQLLERRPDVQQAEAKLIAANARIGVARAQYFPQISLTSLGGAASTQLNAIATDPMRIGTRLALSQSRSSTADASAATIVYQRRSSRRRCWTIRRPS
jgi:outer membrane protein TolC